MAYPTVGPQGLYDQRALTEAINQIPVTEPFLLDNVFTDKQFHNAEVVDIEFYKGIQGVANFVSNDAKKPVPVKHIKKSVKSVTIPRTWESKYFSLQDIININAIGNIYSDPATQKKAQDAELYKELAELKDRGWRRRELMAAQGLTAGLITVEQDEIYFKIDFEFEDTVHKVTLTDTALWTNAASNPIGYIKQCQRYIMQRSFSPMKLILMGANAVDAMLSNANFIKQNRIPNTSWAQDKIDITQNVSHAGGYIGTMLNGVGVYEYSQQYIDPATGLVADMFPSDYICCIASNSGVNNSFRQHIAPIYRKSPSGVQAYTTDFYIDVPYNDADDQGVEWRCEQKPLPAIHNADCLIITKVV